LVRKVALKKIEGDFADESIRLNFESKNKKRPHRTSSEKKTGYVMCNKGER
jgi:hypothetical protein